VQSYGRLHFDHVRIKIYEGPFIGEIRGSHGDEFEDDCLLGCTTVHSGRYWPTFQGITASIIRVVYQSVSTRLRGATTKKTSSLLIR
jgi:hypothetical protein